MCNAYFYFLNIEYIKNQAQLFGFDDITKSILNKDKNELKTALKNYVINIALVLVKKSIL